MLSFLINGKLGQGTHCTKMGADSPAEKTQKCLKTSQPKMKTSDQAQMFEIFEKRSLWVSVVRDHIDFGS